MLEKIKVVYKAISFFFMNIMMRMVYALFPIYPAWCYKHALKARAIVYGYWILFNQKRLSNLLSSNATAIDSWDKVIKDDINVIDIKVHDRFGFHANLYIKDYNQMDISNRSIFFRIYSYLRYLFWYYSIWIWLDDDNNINGLDLRIFNSDSKLYENLKNETAVYVADGARVYTSVFDFAYIQEPKILALDKIMYSVYNQEMNNYMRDKAVYKDYKTVIVMGIGFKVNPLYNRSVVNFFGWDVFKNKDGI